MLREVFDTAIHQINGDQYRSIPIWTGAIQPFPGNPERRIQLDSGQFILNSWQTPSYRQLTEVQPRKEVFWVLIYLMFTKVEERERVLDWLAWCLQNESKKPNWAIILYSKTKGTGKSTLCRIAARLFGQENTSVQNNIEKVAAKFNGPILNSKLVVCEEVNLRPDSEVGNKLKTLITEPFTTAERKGRDVERVPLHSCFLMTTNHLPLWIEAGERRFYVVDVAHDGHAAGPKAASFAQRVKCVEDAMLNDERVAAFYQYLMLRELAEDFDPMTLNTAVHGTAVMKQLLSNQTPATNQQLAEYLGSEGCLAITEQDLRIYVSKEMRVSVNAIRHMMTDLCWTRYEVKWGGKDYARAIWTAPTYAIDRGNILGPNNYSQAVCDVLWCASA